MSKPLDPAELAEIRERNAGPWSERMGYRARWDRQHLLDEVDRLAAELAEANRKLALARGWILNTVDPVAVGKETKQQMLDYLADPPTEKKFATGHHFTPSNTPFGKGDGCEVMLARYRCPYAREEHPEGPPEDVDAFGYRRRPADPPTGQEER